MNNPFFYYIKSGVFHIRIEHTLNCQTWSSFFGELQNELRESSYDEIQINLVQCSDFDSLPLLSICTELFSQKTDVKIIIDKDGLAPKIIEKLISQRFIELFFDKFHIVTSDGVFLKRDDFSENITNHEQILCPPMLFDLKPKNADKSDAICIIENAAESIIQSMNLYLGDTTLDTNFKNKLYHILIETIDNVQNHAYTDNVGIFPVGIFLRKRYGFFYTSDKKTTNDIQTLYKQEKEFIPFNNDVLKNNSEVYELIVTDCGIGLCESLEVKNTDGSSSKYPFIEMFKRTLNESLRKKYSDTNFKSYHSGLNVIFQLLKESNDYIIGNDGKEWAFSFCDDKFEPKKLIVKNEVPVVRGLSWIFQIPNKKNISFENHINEISVKAPVSVAKCFNYRFEISDRSFDDIYIVENRQNYAGINNAFINENSMSSATKYVLFLDKYLSKNTILSFLHKLFLNSQKNNLHLFIYDINPQELPVYFNAFEWLNLNSKYSFTKKVNKIILVTKSLDTSIFIATNEKYIYSQENTKQFCANPYAKGSTISTTLYSTLSFLRYYDSCIFWSYIYNSPAKDKIVINGNINWNNQEISKYLNIESLLQKLEIRNLILLSIHRYSSLFGGISKMRGMDVVTKPLAIEYEKKHPHKDINGSSILLGSVFCSGNTDNLFDTSDEKSLKIHLFVNTTSTHKDIQHLFLWPNTTIFDKLFEKTNIVWKRVGNSHSICKINEPSTITKIVDKKSLDIYMNDFKASYLDLTRNYPSIIKFGHFNYHGNHDLFAFDIENIILSDFQKKKGIVEYLILQFSKNKNNNLFRYLKPEWKRAIEISTTKTEFNFDFFVCISHFYNKILCDTLNSAFDIDFEKLNIIALHSSRNKIIESHLLISSLEIDLIREKLERINKDNIDILFYDSLIYSEKTKNDVHVLLKHIAENMGKTISFKTISMFDCRRNLYITNSNSEKSLYCFDLPRLGNKNNCPLCRAIEIASIFRNEILGNLKSSNSNSDLSSFGVERIEEWISIWRDTTPLSASENISFVERNIESFLELRKYFNDIEIKSFKQLTVLVVEMLSALNYSDIVLQLCSENCLSELEKLELLLLQKLLFDVNSNFSLNHKICRQIIVICAAEEQESPLTALASLVIISQDLFLVEKVLSEFTEENNAQWNELNVLNCDALLMLAYFHNKLPVTIKKLKNEKQLKLFFSPPLQNFDFYREFHSQVLNDSGKSHNIVFSCLTRGVGTSMELRNLCIDAMNKLPYIIKMISQISPTEVTSTEQTLHDLREIACKQIHDLNPLINNIFARAIADNLRSAEEIRNQIDSMINAVLDIHSLLFIKLGKESSDIQAEPPIISAVIEILNRFTQKATHHCKNLTADCTIDGVYYFFDEETEKLYSIVLDYNYDASFKNILDSKKEVWYLWNQRVVKELEYLITDVRHSVDTLKSIPFCEIDPHMQIRFEFNTDCAKIILRNTSKISGDDIEQIILEKYRYQRNLLKTYNTTVKYESQKMAIDKFTIDTVYTIPGI